MIGQLRLQDSQARPSAISLCICYACGWRKAVWVIYVMYTSLNNNIEPALHRLLCLEVHT